MSEEKAEKQRFIVKTNKTGNDHLLSDLFKKGDVLAGTNERQKADKSNIFLEEGSSQCKQMVTPQVLLSKENHNRKTLDPRKSTSNANNNLVKLGITKKRKKRHIFSCKNCRKLKTKCTVNPFTTSCYRCERLHLNCNLGKLNLDSNKECHQLDGSLLEKQLFQIQKNYEYLNEKIDKVIDAVTNRGKIDQKSESVSSLSRSISNRSDLHPILPRYNDFSPMNVMNQIHSSLPRKSPTRPDALRQSLSNFLNFYMENESLCLLLSKTFLETAHYWIIPGGISEIDREYVFHHPVNACVYVMLAMAFDMENKYSLEEKLLYPIAKSIITNILVSVPRSDHDIEALLYVALYGITRRGGRVTISLAGDNKNDKNYTLADEVLVDSFDGWSISSSCFNHCIISLDLKSIYERASKEFFTDDDIFHLRIFNASCCSHYQCAIGYGRPTVINSSYVHLHKLILQYPNATIGDAIKVAELELYWTLCVDIDKIMSGCAISTDSQTGKNDERGAHTYLFDDLEEWYHNWGKIMSKDVTHGLQLSYYFAHVVLALQLMKYRGDGGRNKSKGRKNKSLKNSARDVSVAREQACKYSFCIIKLFLSLPKDSIKGSPLFLFCEIVYACVSLFDFRESMNMKKQKASLSAISKVYWHLNKAGEGINVATESIAGLVRKLVELANNHEKLKYEEAASFVGSGSITETYIRKRHIKRRDSQQQRHLSVEDLPALVREKRRRSSLHFEDTKKGLQLKQCNTDSSLDRNGASQNVRSANVSPRHGKTRPFDSMLLEEQPESGDADVLAGDDDIIIPDVTNFRSFEEFFYDIFNEHTSDI